MRADETAMRSTAMLKILNFGGFFVVHWIAQFWAWSYAEHSTTGRWCWLMLATPLVHLHGSLPDKYFTILTVLNSALWATCLIFLVSRTSLINPAKRYRTRHTSRRG